MFEETLLYSQTNDIWMVEARCFHELGLLEQINENYDKAYGLFSKSYEIRVANNARPAIVSSLISMAQVDVVNKDFTNAEIKLFVKNKTGPGNIIFLSLGNFFAIEI